VRNLVEEVDIRARKRRHLNPVKSQSDTVFVILEVLGPLGLIVATAFDQVAYLTVDRSVLHRGQPAADHWVANLSERLAIRQV